MTAEFSELFRRADQGDHEATNRLFVLMYADLRRLAHARVRKSRNNAVLDTTELVHESYMRLLGSARLKLNDRKHFLAYSSRVMRSVIVDFVRERQADRRGGHAIQVTLDTSVADPQHKSEEQVIRINDALAALSESDPRLVQVVELRYFVGLKESEIALLLNLSEVTVKRDWRKARLLLNAALS